MEEDPRPYFYCPFNPIKRKPTPPPLRRPLLDIPAYRKRDISGVVDKCGIEILGQITCNVLRVRRCPRGKSGTELYESCIANGIYPVRKTTPKIYYAELLMKL
jgi:hypothetical protein